MRGRMKTRVAIFAPLAVLLLSFAVITGVWWWLATPVTLVHGAIGPETKLDCVSYAPFRNQQTPWKSTIVISEAQIAEDLVELARVSRCIRTYSIENGLDRVPELASKVGLKVILGVWLGRDPLKNASLIDTATALARQYPVVVSAMMVGSEVLLRGEMKAPELCEIIRSVKAQVGVPVSYADVWEFWLRNPDISKCVDFVTVHILPYWEDDPVRAEDAASHTIDIRKRVALAFPGKEILIGETGWPGRGRMRAGALPSRINQARYVSEVLERARKESFRVNVFEAYDEPWKRQWEGTIGSSWGLYDGETRELKYPAGVPVTNYPFWKLQLCSGLMLSACVFAAAFWASRRRSKLPRPEAWAAVAISATVGGVLLGLAAEKWLYESFGLFSWVMQSLLLAAAVAAPLLSSMAVMSERGLPTLLDVIGRSESRLRSLETIILGGTLAVVTLVAAVTALNLVFDPRWRDFPYPALTMAAVPLWMVTLFNRSKSSANPKAEASFATLLAVAALFILFNEGFANWQSLWLCAAYGLLSVTLWRVQPGTVRWAALTLSGVAQAVLPSRLQAAVTGGAYGDGFVAGSGTGGPGLQTVEAVNEAIGRNEQAG
ncbi:MAG TPA: glycosyl hydrolase family 17 protein [Bradyrhizobium sp.]|nr:glycosyl hydrolase family 17 protein [Bradyrhizobium sp.]